MSLYYNNVIFIEFLLSGITFLRIQQVLHFKEPLFPFDPFRCEKCTKGKTPACFSRMRDHNSIHFRFVTHYMCSRYIL